jgi:putative transposase
VDVLGMWISENEGAHFWQTVLNDLKERGVQYILIACVDGLKGFPEAIEAIFPKTHVQLCVVHQIRTALRYTGSKYHKELIKDMKLIYNASTLENAEKSLENFEEKWSKNAPAAAASWRNNWACLSTFFEFPQEVRKIIYTTNAVESLHRQFRKVTKAKGSFPTDDSVKKMLYLAVKGLRVKKKNNWSTMLGQLKNYFGDRVY